ncbi:conserved hypothetical protein [Methanohalobium evestigatum Z-7303]|uniref:Uncharacterized protein n=1 Tax=Methanohalobium evestigatum (strain ATCC BAA-1072 / DSM 3721 / NBRC 107634 / OCM 161 / Z-7303) TaxID=644295 RepID=D7E930_METEZ|nr:hypothetical protein [Methanohalobium evestigatum]ADI73978.1 conserved hypothetical protein [Methanohalobium evestigatum Z-7303]
MHVVKVVKKVGVAFLVLLLTMSFVGAAADGNEEYITEKSGYIVTPGEDEDTNIGIMKISDLISQGETDWHYKYVSSGINVLNVNLDWGDTSDSLKLTVHTPGGYELGPFYDTDDGSVDGQINIDIENSNGLATGYWGYEIYGEQVDGTEDYTI